MLSVNDLKVHFSTRRGQVQAVRNASFKLNKGESLGIVGESGSGKSVTSYAIMRILAQGGSIEQGTINYNGINLRQATAKDMRDIRGREISMIFQNPRVALNPIRKVGKQIEDVLRRHARATRNNAKQAAIEALRMVRIHDPEKRYHAYPYELSGGMCQRVVIALALACEPQLLIADEPTTGLDVTTQKTVMDLLAELTQSHARAMSFILITHDLGLAAEYCDRIIVMKDGVVVEQGIPTALFRHPQHAYTRRLMRATPRSDSRVGDLLEPPVATPERSTIGESVLEVTRLSKRFGNGAHTITAVDNVSFTLHAGETLGLVGESGCGKSTLSSIIIRLLDPSSGQVLLDGQSITDVPAKQFAHDPRRSALQMVFQDATDSLNPHFSARQVIADPIRRLTDDNPKERVDELAHQVGLPIALLDRFPHQLSGGQKARVNIARALASRPKLLILDEPTAALDVSIQALVLNLLAELRARSGLSMLFVSHDLHVVRLLCDRIMVMRQGKIIERGMADNILQSPQQDYTRQLLEATLRLP